MGLGKLKVFMWKRSYHRLPKLLRYRQGKQKNIVLFASRRGGSTIVSQILSLDKRTRYVDQPFDLTPDSIYLAQLKKYIYKPYLSQFISFKNDSEKGLFDKHLMSVMGGGLPFFWKNNALPSNRTLVKTCNAFGLFDYIKKEYPDFQRVNLLRHPIPQSLSVMSNNWINTSQAYLDNDEYCKKYLSNLQRRRGYEILQEGSKIEGYLLNWILENLPLIHSNEELYFYEDLILNPRLFVQKMKSTFDLESSIEELVKVVESPSFSNSFSEATTNKAILNGDKEYLLSKWKTKLTKEELIRLDSVLSFFDISIYDCSNIKPLIH